MKNKIILIIPYYGKFPNYFQLWLDSCGNNKNLNFMIVSDIESKHIFPPNVKKIKLTFDELKSKIQNNFDFTISLNHPYKLCDFRIAYGEIFAEEIKGYDFWGHCDCDLIFGNICNFITDEILDKHDRILSRGHLSLYRNNEEINAFYRTADPEFDYKKILSTDQGFSADEWGGKIGISNYWKKHRDHRMYDERMHDDIHALKKHFTSPPKTLLPNTLPRKNLCFVFSKDSLKSVYDGGEEETLYAHFQKRKMQIDENVIGTTKYVIIPNKFVPYDEKFENDPNFRRIYCKRRMIYVDAIKMRFRNLIRKIKKYVKF